MQQRLKALRKKYRITQAAFGEKIGIPRDTVTNWEIGRVSPPEAAIKLIVHEFGVSYDWLKNGIGPMFASGEDEMKAALQSLAAGENERVKALIRTLASLTEEQLETAEQILAAYENRRGRP